MIRSVAYRTLLPLFLAMALPAVAFAQMAVDRLRIAQPADQYARKAAAADLYEKQAGELILKSSRNPEIRKLAQAMIADHARSAADLRAAATQSGITVNPQLSTIEFKQLLGRLTAATGEARDTLYLTQQRAVLPRTLFLHQDYAAGGDQPALKEAAARTAPMIQSHIDMLNAVPVPPLVVSGNIVP
jgi:putative membrane protein